MMEGASVGQQPTTTTRRAAKESAAPGPEAGLAEMVFRPTETRPTAEAEPAEGLLETPSCSQKVKGKHSRGSGCHCVGTLRAVHFHHNEERMLAIFSQGVLCSIAETTGDSIATLVLIPVPKVSGTVLEPYIAVLSFHREYLRTWMSTTANILDD